MQEPSWGSYSIDGYNGEVFKLMRFAWQLRSEPLSSSFAANFNRKYGGAVVNQTWRRLETSVRYASALTRPISGAGAERKRNGRPTEHRFWAKFVLSVWREVRWDKRPTSPAARGAQLAGGRRTRILLKPRMQVSAPPWSGRIEEIALYDDLRRSRGYIRLGLSRV
ncbi:unnamed protein product, partial [Iphiclides podalirius]